MNFSSQFPLRLGHKFQQHERSHGGLRQSQRHLSVELAPGAHPMGTLSPPPSAFQAATGKQSVPGQRPAVTGACMGALEEPVLAPQGQRLGARAVLPPSWGG